MAKNILSIADIVPEYHPILPPQTPWEPPTAVATPTHGEQSFLTPWDPPPTGPPPDAPGHPGGGRPPVEVMSPVDDCMRSVTVANVLGNATVDVFVNGVWRGSGRSNMIDPYFGVTANVEVAINGCSLNVSDLVQARVNGHFSRGVRVESHVKYSCLTQHYDNARTGWYQYENQLTVDLLGQSAPYDFKQQFQLPVDGKVYAQPLYMHHVNFPGLGARNVVFLATENDTVYAYDADDPGPNGNGVLLWQRSLLQPGERAPITDQKNVPSKDRDIDCGDIQPTVGVSATPVISCSCDSTCCGSSGNGCGTPCGCSVSNNVPACCQQTLYVVSKSVSGTQGVADSLKFHIYLHALDIITGTERSNSPVELGGQVKGDGLGSVNGIITFDPRIQNVRPGLLLLNGCIFIASASHCDHDNYHGWVMSYDAKTLRQKSVFCTTPDGKYAAYDVPSPNNIGQWGGIWQAGQGLASDGESIYFTTGNGGLSWSDSSGVHFINSFNANVGGNNYGNSVLKLGQNLKVKSFFTPADQWSLDFSDADFGSGGVMVLPPQLGAHPNQLVTMGKDSTIFLLDRDEMGGFAGDAPHPTTPLATGQYGSNPNAVTTIGVAGTISPTDTVGQPGIWGGPAFYNGEHAQTIYYGRNDGPITAFNIREGVLTREGTTLENFGNLGTTPVVTSNHQLSSTQLVWAILRNFGGNTALTVYDAIALRNGTTLLPTAVIPSGPIIIGAWAQGSAFIVPTIVNGKVYAACENHVGVFYCANEDKVP